VDRYSGLWPVVPGLQVGHHVQLSLWDAVAVGLLPPVIVTQLSKQYFCIDAVHEGMIWNSADTLNNWWTWHSADKPDKWLVSNVASTSGTGLILHCDDARYTGLIMRRGRACVLAVTAGINTQHINTVLALIGLWGTAWSSLKSCWMLVEGMYKVTSPDNSRGLAGSFPVCNPPLQEVQQACQKTISQHQGTDIQGNCLNDCCIINENMSIKHMNACIDKHQPLFSCWELIMWWTQVWSTRTSSKARSTS